MSNKKWIATWGTSQQLVEPNNLPPAPGLEDNTIRQIFRVSLGGKKLRVKLSNLYGDTPILLGAVHLAESQQESSIIVSTDKSLTFEGLSSVTIPAGKEVYSDTLSFDLAPLSCVAVTIWSNKISSKVITGHPGSRTTSFITPGNAVSAYFFESPIITDHWYIITGVDLLLDNSYASIVVLGDSITDGRGTTTNGNDRWTDILAQRLQANPTTKKISVINQGIGGNNILSDGLGLSAVKRFDHDVLEQAGVRWLIILEGVNDIGTSDMNSNQIAESLITAYSQFIRKAHEKNIQIFVASILPFGGNEYDTYKHETARQKINNWITNNREFDAFIDFESAIKDPKNPTKLLPLYDSTDHLHLNQAGYRCLGEAVDLELFKN